MLDNIHIEHFITEYIYGIFSVDFFSIIAFLPSTQISKDKKEEIWPSPMTKAPIPTEMSKGQSDNTNNAKKKFD